MKVRGCGLLVAAALWLGLFCGSAMAAATPGPSVATQQTVVVKAGALLRVYEQFHWTAPPKGAVRYPLPHGAAAVSSQGGHLTVGPGAVVAPAASADVAFSFVMPATDPLVWSASTVAATGTFTLLTGPGILPSGPALAPLQYQGDVRLGGVSLRSFAAKDLPAGYAIFLPMMLHDSGPVYGLGALALLSLLALSGLAAAGWWGFARFGRAGAG